MSDLGRSPLGHATGYPDTYDRSQLFAVSRAPQRALIGVGDPLPFTGVDLWTAYELSWLDARGKPAVAIAMIDVPITSPAIVESKSMKLYLGSFAQSPYADANDVADTIERDVGSAIGAPVSVTLIAPDRFGGQTIANLDGENIDGADVAFSSYEVDADLLQASRPIVDETVRTDLFRSVCPVTGQPDIASVQIAYRGPRIDRAALLRYIVSYRCHPGFHEHCVERMFVDVRERCRCERLTVYARFTRRGGIDINPFRTNADAPLPPNVRTARQ